MSLLQLYRISLKKEKFLLVELYIVLWARPLLCKYERRRALVSARRELNFILGGCEKTLQDVQF